MAEIQGSIQNQSVPVFVDVAGPSGQFTAVFTHVTNENGEVKQEKLDQNVENQFPAEQNTKSQNTVDDGTPQKNQKIRCTEQSMGGQCRYTTEATERLVRHIRKVHRGENPFQCTMCDYTTYNKAVFEEHVRVHQGIKPFTCSFCPYRSASKKNARKHEQIHRPDNPLRCQLCGFIARHVRSLEFHNRKHMREIPCEDCSFKADNMRNYLLHRRQKHNKRKGVDETWYSCDNCDSSFAEAKSLQSHKRKVKKCDECDASICTKQLYKKHMIMVHNKKSDGDNCFVCAICQWTSTSKPRILLHLIHHPNQEVSECVVDVTVLRNFGIMK